MKGSDPQKPVPGRFAQTLKKLGRRLGVHPGRESEETVCPQAEPTGHGAEQPAAAKEAPPQAAAHEKETDAASVRPSAREPRQTPEAEHPDGPSPQAAANRKDGEKPVWAMLGLSSHNRPTVERQILERGCVPGYPSKKATYLVYDPERAPKMKYWPEARRREKEGSLVLVPEIVFSLWAMPDPANAFAGKNISWKRLLLEHYFTAPEAWAREGKGLKEAVDTWLSGNSLLLLKYAGNDLTDLYISWLVRPEDRGALDALPVSELTVPFLSTLWARYCAGGRERSAGRFEKKAVQTHPLLLQALMERKEYRAMFALLDLVRADEEEKKRSGASDGYYTYSLVNSYLEQATASGDPEANVLWLEYKNTRFSQPFTDEAEETRLLYGLGQCSRPDIYLQNGATYIFGHYPQTATGESKPIEWTVLERQEDTLLLISKYALSPGKFHETFEPVTWEKCSLRSWLNGAFRDSAFSAAEQARLITAEVPAHGSLQYLTDPGRTTRDAVFVLSVKEADRYFSSDADRVCRTTDHCEASFGYPRGKAGKSGWWLRTPGRVGTEIAYVSEKGYIYQPGSGVTSAAYSVRPCIRVRL